MSVHTAHSTQFDNPLSAVRARLTAATVYGLARWTPYVESEIRGLRQVVTPGSVCVDVGAAAGLYTMALSRLCGRTGRVHSVEPLPFANFQLARLLSAWQAHNVRRHVVALGALPGQDLMHVPLGRYGLVTGRSFLDGSAAGPDPNVEFANQISVAVTVDTLDGLCSREGIDRLEFVKIDVEGAELQVLEGGKEVIGALRPTMLIEIEARHTARYQRTPEDVTTWMLDRGYTMHAWRRSWQPARSIEAGTRNYLFQPSGRGRGASEKRPGREATVPA
ncbi:MAG: FkbM family methyltransferase [Acidimicrobiales bacterium]